MDSEEAEQEQDPGVLLRAAQLQVRKMQDALSIYRMILAALAVVVVLLVGNGVVTGIALLDITGNNHNACLSGNTFRANDQLRWDKFIDLLVSGSHPSAQGLAEARDYLALVAKTDAQRAC